jgi:cyanophycinase-like exopeptidase
VFPLSRVGVLVAGGAVELIEAVGVLAKVGGYPVQDDADAVLVHAVHEEHEVLGGPVP